MTDFLDMSILDEVSITGLKRQVKKIYLDILYVSYLDE